MPKDTIVKTIRELGAAMGFKTLKIEGSRISIDAGEFISFALHAKNGSEEEEEEEETEGPSKDLVLKVIADLGKPTSEQIRNALKNDHGIRVNAAALRPILATLREEEKIVFTGEARAKRYSRKGKK